MKKTAITVMEAARNFAQCVNRVHYQNQCFVLVKNGKPLARLVPETEKVCTGRESAEALADVELPTAEALAFPNRRLMPCATQHQKPLKYLILCGWRLALAFSAGTVVAVPTNAVPAATEPVAANVSSLKLFPPEKGLSLLTSAPTVISTNAYPLKIVTCRRDVDMDALLKEFNITLQSPKHRYHALNGFAALLDDATIKKLKADPRVLYVEADGAMNVSGQYTMFPLSRLDIAQFPLAHINGTPKPLDVDVAIIDSSIDPNIDLETYNNDFYAFGYDATDALGHGTMVAGIVAMTDNGLGFVGVAPGVRIWNVKVIGPAPDDAWSYILSGMDFVLQNADQISVANISINNTGTTAPVNAIQSSLRRLVAAGVVVVVSAGNASMDLAGPDGIYGTGDDAVPAGLPDAMAVSAMDASPLTAQPYPFTNNIWFESNFPYKDQMWTNSNFSQIVRTNIPTFGTNYVFSSGGAIDVAAPGVNIFSTAARSAGEAISRNWGVGTGTSFAAPHVTGLIALYIAANGRATNAEGVYRIRQAIVDNAQPQSQWMPNGFAFDAVTNNTGDPDTNPEPLAIASENWVPRPAITRAAGASVNFQVNFATVPGYDYTVQSATNLTPPILWTNLSTATGSSNVVQVALTDTNAASQGFYRLARTPSP